MAKIFPPYNLQPSSHAYAFGAPCGEEASDLHSSAFLFEALCNTPLHSLHHREQGSQPRVGRTQAT